VIMCNHYEFWGADFLPAAMESGDCGD